MFMICYEISRYIANGRYNKHDVLISYILLYVIHTIMFHDLFLPDEIVYSVLLSPGFTSSSVTQRLLQKDRTQATSHRRSYLWLAVGTSKVSNLRLIPRTYDGPHATDLIR